MGGGGIWRDAATHEDASTGKTFAYVAAQGTQSGGNPDTYVVDLSYLSGDINNPDLVDSDPIPPSGYQNIGYTGKGHTMNVARGLLFLNTASSTDGCIVFDLTADPWNPRELFNTGGSGQNCHDSFVREDLDVSGTLKDILFVSDGSGRLTRFYDITNVDASWTAGTPPPQVGETIEISGIYSHECWLSEDGRYLFEFDETSNGLCIVHDVSDLANPVWITTFHHSEQDSWAALPHNGQVRGNYLYVAYYWAGERVFDISNPYVPG